jgi:O-antigen/teichoic acid export membrane protein
MDEQLDGMRSNAELTQAAAGGLRWITYARIAIEATLLGSMVVLARLIPPAEFGIFAVVVIVQELALTMPMEGIGSALVQRRTIDREHLQGGLVLSLGIGALLSLLTIVLALVVVDPLFGERTASLVLLAVPWYVLGALYCVPMAVLRRRLDFRKVSLIDITQNLVRVAVTIAMALAGLDAEALILGCMAGMAAAVALALAFVRVPLPRWRPHAMRDLLPYGGPAALSCVAWTGFRNGDYAIIGATLGTAAAGLYWRGYQLAVEYQRKISVVMTQMAFPVLARAETVQDMLVLRRRMVQLLTVVLFPMLVTLVLLAPIVVPWLFGPAWRPAVLPTQILALGGAAVLVTDAVGSALQAHGRARALLGYGIAHFGVYAGTVLVVASHGLVAVALAASIVHTAFLLIAYRVLMHRQEGSALGALWDDVAPASVACVALLAAAGPAEWGLARLEAPALAHIVGVGAPAAIFYLLALRSWFPASWADLSAALHRVAPGGVRAAVRVCRLSPVLGRGAGSS